MFASKKLLAVVAASSSLALAGCMSPYGGLGVGYGSDGYYGGYGTYGAYGGYGNYGGYSPYGYGSYGGYSPYGYGSSYGGYSPYGYSPYGGWYDNYYYPGTGYYVYSRNGSRQRWTDAQRRYWETRRAQHRDGDGAHRNRDGQRDGNWDGRRHRSGDSGVVTSPTVQQSTTPTRTRSWSGSTSARRTMSTDDGVRGERRSRVHSRKPGQRAQSNAVDAE